MIKQTLIAAVTVSALIASGAYAANAKALTGIVVGGQAGYLKTEPFKASNGVTNGGLFGGGIVGYDYAINNSFLVGVEANLNYGHEILKAGNAKLNIVNAPILLKLEYVTPIGVNMFIKGGYGYNKYTSSDSQDNVSISESYNKWAPVAAAGVGYQIERWNIFAQYTHTFGKKTNDSNFNKDAMTADAITGGVTYTIPM